VVLDVQALSSVTDFFLVCSGRSTTHVATIADAIRDELKAEGVRRSTWRAWRRWVGAARFR
jgi:ribosome-associated protein